MTNPFGGKYFAAHPENVLGEIVTHNPNTGRLLTDAYGKARPEVRGTLAAALARIDAPIVRPYRHEPRRVAAPAQVQDRLAAALELTKQEDEAVRANPGSKYSCSEGTICLADSIEANRTVTYKDPADGQIKTYVITEQEMTAFVAYQVRNGIWDKATIQGNAWGKYLDDSKTNYPYLFLHDVVAHDGEQWVPSAIFYSGNIYLKINEVKGKKAAIVEKVGEDGFAKIMERLEAARPMPLRFTTDPRTALIISPLDKIWDEIKFEADGDGIAFNEPIGVMDFFKRWIRQLPIEQFVVDNGRTASNPNMVRMWLDGDSFPRNSTLSEEQKAAAKRNAAIVGQVLFERFCIEGIRREDQVKVEYLFNSTRNHYAPVAFHRIPVGYSTGQKFKGGSLGIRPAQREGVAFCSYRGTGIVAFDVGVGKTATAILSVEDGFGKGLFKRPLIVTPNGVYWKWVAEIEGERAKKDVYRDGRLVARKGEKLPGGEGLLPHRSINTFFNLGAEIAVPKQADGSAKPVEEGTITMLTFEGLEKIGFRAESEKGLMQVVKAALSQGESGRAEALTEKSAEGWIDNALKNTEYNIEDFGFDAIIVDEAHNFRNLFMEVRGDVGKDGEREKKRFFAGGSGQPSTRAIKLFMLNTYLHLRHNNRNTIGLTATPFTNQATEIYSMLSHFDYEGLKEFDVFNLSQFCTQFIDETNEITWTAQGKFQSNAVIRGYNNIPVLQAILYRSINYKTGEDANIARPQKVVLPLTADEKGVPLPAANIIETRLPETDLQSEWLKDAYAYAGDKWEGTMIFEKGEYPINQKTKKPDGQVLVALNVARVATISPYAISLAAKPAFNLAGLTYKQFVESSPKLLYAMGCIDSVVKYHKQQKTDVSGQIIYCNTGTQFFPFIKEYLVREIGFKDSEVEILTGETAQGKREKIKEGFQANEIKVLIGSSAIREGMDLQKHCSCIYVLYLDWNPTDLHQLYGRGWRFGNKFSHVRIVIPLVENSSDIFTWQKLSEKMSRLNSIWAKSGQTKMFEEKELNAEELKRGLISDPRELAKFEIEEQVNLVQNQLTVLQGNQTEIKAAIESRDKIGALTANLIALHDKVMAQKARTYYYASYKEQEAKEAEAVAKVQAMPYEGGDLKQLYQKLRAWSRLESRLTWFPIGGTDKAVDDHIKASKTLTRVKETILAAYKMDLEDLDKVAAKVADEIAETETTIAELRGAEYFQKVLARAVAEKEEQRASSRSVADRVREFARLNYLLDCRFEKDVCDLYGRGTATSPSREASEQMAQTMVTVADSATVAAKRRPNGKSVSDFKLVKRFMPKHQQKVVNGFGEEREPVLRDVEAMLAKIPKAYSQEKVPNDEKIVWAHYFYGTSDWYIFEFDPDSEVPEYDRFFGYVILNGDMQMAELGWINVDELVNSNRVELDFHWQPKTLGEVLGKKMPKPRQVSVKVDNLTALREAIEALEIALEFSPEPQQITEAIEALKLAVEFA